MKNLSISVFCIFLVLSVFSGYGQEQKIPLNEPDYNKPKVFHNLPDSIPVSDATLSGFFNLSKGEKIVPKYQNRSEVPGFLFRGEVVSKSDDMPANTKARSAGPASIRSMIVKLTDYKGSNFTISKITEADGTIRYTGRIINFKSGDLFILEKVNGNLMLIKKDYYALVNE